MNEYHATDRRNLAQASVIQTDAFTPISPTVGVHERVLTLQAQQYAKQAVDYWTGESLRREEFLKTQRIASWLREMRKYRR